MVFRIVGDRVILRRLFDSDIPVVYELAGDYEIARYTYIPCPYEPKDAEDFVKRASEVVKNVFENGFKIKAGINCELGIDYMGEGIVGIIGLMRIEFGKKAEIGYWIAKKYWRKGIGTEAVNLILKFGFEELKLKEVYAGVMHPNMASRKLLESIGFNLIRRNRNKVFREGRWFDEFRYLMSYEDWAEKQR